MSRIIIDGRHPDVYRRPDGTLVLRNVRTRARPDDTLVSRGAVVGRIGRDGKVRLAPRRRGLTSTRSEA